MVAVGRALVSDPKLVILDEPTFGLSPQLTENMCEFLGEVGSRDRTVIIAEQNVDVASQVATSMAVMTNGVLSAVAPVDDVMRSEAFEAAAYG
jgi:branched-chain amino acid transport system ATP-binding protein